MNLTKNLPKKAQRKNTKIYDINLSASDDFWMTLYVSHRLRNNLNLAILLSKVDSIK